MRAEIVHNDDVAFFERFDKALLHPSQEAHSVDGAIEDIRRGDFIVAQGGDEGRRLPMTMRHIIDEAFAFQRPAAQRCHVGLGPCFVEKN